MVSLRAPGTLLWPSPLQEKPVTPAGSGSLTATLLAVLGPVLLTTMVEVVLVPGTAVVALAVLVTRTSFCGVSVSVSVALLLAGLMSPAAVTLAVLVSEPVAEALMAATTV